MTDRLPRQHLPDEWAARAYCPVCRAPALSVQRAPSEPDHMRCGRCGATFVVEQNGPHVRVTHWPSALASNPHLMASGWLTVAEITALVRQATSPPAAATPSTPVSEPAPPPAAEPAPTPPPQSNLDTTVERAKKLYTLGNRFTVIEAALKNSGATAEEIEAALAALRGLDEQKRRGQQNRLRLASAVALAGLMVVLMFAAFNSFGRRPAAPTSAPGGAAGGTPVPTSIPYNPVIDVINRFLPTGVAIVNGPSPTPGPRLFIFPTATPKLRATLGGPTFTSIPTQDSGLPNWVLTAAPPGIKILDVPTPSVERGVGPGNSACPQTSDGAAELFGGKNDYWAYASQQNGWTLIVADNPITITIPSNMTAGYLVVGQSLYMTSAAGPATIRNVNFAAVSCE